MSSQFWRLEVQNQGIGRAVLPAKALGKNPCWTLLASGSVQFSSVAQSCLTVCSTMDLSMVMASLSITNSWNLLRFMSIESVMPSNHLILCRPLLLLPSIFLSVRVFSNELLVVASNPRHSLACEHIPTSYLCCCLHVAFSSALVSLCPSVKIPLLL